VPSLRALAVVAGHPGIELSESLAFAEDAERAGFGILSAGDGLHENFAMVGALAARTSRAELISTAATWTRTPVTAASGATTLQALSGGRYRLGLGAMPKQWSEKWHRVDYSRPVDRMRDYVGAIRAAWEAVPGSPRSYEGPFYSFEDYERLVPPPDEPVPIYLATTRPRMTALAGELAQGAVFNAVHSVKWLEEVQLPALASGLERAGRTRADVDLGQLVYCVIADDEATAIDLARPGIAFYFVAPYMQDLLRLHGWDAELERGLEATARRDAAGMAAAITDEMVQAITIAGTAEQVRERVRRYEGLVDWPLLAAPLGHPPEVVRELSRRIVETFAGVAVGG
jgi:probable F420-dependent oxidoreductase